MEPFATKPASRSGLHWWIVGGIAAAFLIWQFDLIPRVRSAATGAVANPMSEGKALEETDSFLSSDWSDIRDADLDAEDSHDVANDTAYPLSRAVAQSRQVATRGAESQDSQRSEGNNGRSRNVRRDSQIEQSSWNPESSRNAGGTRSHDKPPAVLTADLADRLRLIAKYIDSDQILEAHRELSQIYWKHPEHRHLIQEQIDETASIIFATPERQFAEPHFVDYGETLGSIAKKYSLPWQYLARLNRIDPDELQAGQQLKVVQGPFGAVVDLNNFCLTVEAHGWYVHRYSVGIGADNRTPTGKFNIKEKLENPTWYNPDGGVVDADDPENPLGEFWLGLGDHIGIHGTIDPDSVGQAVSRGCIHLNDGDIDDVFGMLSVGSKVLIRH